jgi:hypothetical protein
LIFLTLDLVGLHINIKSWKGTWVKVHIIEGNVGFGHFNFLTHKADLGNLVKNDIFIGKWNISPDNKP